LTTTPPYGTVLLTTTNRDNDGGYTVKTFELHVDRNEAMIATWTAYDLLKRLAENHFLKPEDAEITPVEFFGARSDGKLESRSYLHHPSEPAGPFAVVKIIEDR
jgi:hypothetical protein